MVKAFRDLDYRIVATSRSIQPFTSYTHGDYAAALAVNLGGFFYISQLAIAEMEKQGSGHVVNITTSLADHAIEGVPSVLASLTKGGLNAATKSLAIEYAKRGIRVNAVSPGIIKTPMNGVETRESHRSYRPDSLGLCPRSGSELDRNIRERWWSVLTI